MELLLATLSLRRFRDRRLGHSMARAYLASGQANSIRFGNGLFDWAFHNLAAVVDREDDSKSDEEVRRQFRTCLEFCTEGALPFSAPQKESGRIPLL